ncbi:MAG TPA: aminotransferase class I/II-fold pyridoxal phosphate-dependent enzyme, partial [Thermoanaerobaculia bacterium]|nr:aminotransferase class I/II-fold pyridoxal phosphate-dependent enzyme [Thermoanaerobaculia bacterium]
EATQAAPASWWGSLGSQYLGGTHEERLAFEAEVAAAAGKESGVAFVSGWAANYAVGEALGKLCDVIVSDARNHNSMVHGLRTAREKVLRLDLRQPGWSEELRRRTFERAAVVAPSVEGITGEAVDPFAGLDTELRSRLIVVLDECHTFGALGETGVEPVTDEVPDVRIGGFGKAFGTMGSVVCASRGFNALLEQLASPWMFSTAAPPVIWRVNQRVFPEVLAMREERERILRLAIDFRARLEAAGIDATGRHHITGVRIPADRDAPELEAEVRRAGFLLKISLYPTRPRESPCARVAFTPEHTDDDVAGLADCLGRVLQG